MKNTESPQQPIVALCSYNFSSLDSIDKQMLNISFYLYWLQKYFDCTSNTHLGLWSFYITHFHKIRNSSDIYQHHCISDNNLLDSYLSD